MRSCLRRDAPGEVFVVGLLLADDDEKQHWIVQVLCVDEGALRKENQISYNNCYVIVNHFSVYLVRRPLKLPIFRIRFMFTL